MNKKKGRKFEEYVEERLKRLYPGYKCTCQKRSKTTGKIPDGVCYHWQKRR